MSFSKQTTTPSDISILISKCSSKENQINKLESKLFQSRNEYNATITTLNTKLVNLEEDNINKDKLIDELKQTIQFLEIDNKEHCLFTKHLESKLFSKTLEFENIKQQLSETKYILKQTLERNNSYVQKLSDIEHHYSEQILKITELSQEYKRKIKLMNKPKIN